MDSGVQVKKNPLEQIHRRPDGIYTANEMTTNYREANRNLFYRMEALSVGPGWQEEWYFPEGVDNARYEKKKEFGTIELCLCGKELQTYCYVVTNLRNGNKVILGRTCCRCINPVLNNDVRRNSKIHYYCEKCDCYVVNYSLHRTTQKHRRLEELFEQTQECQTPECKKRIALESTYCHQCQADRQALQNSS